LCVACSNAYPSLISVGSLQAIPLKLMPNGCGFASNPSGNGGFGAFGTMPKGTITVGYPGRAATEAPYGPGKRMASRLFAFITSFDELTIAIFISGGIKTTLPKQMWDDALLKVSPTLAAVSTVLLVFVTAMILLAEHFRRRTAAPTTR